MSPQDCLIIIPCYRASGKISNVTDSLILEGIGQVIVVNDCCPDDSTSEIVSKDIKVIKTPQNSGVGGAFLYGVEYALSSIEFKYIKYIAKIDADGQHSVIDLKNMFRFINTSRCDLLKGNRYMLGRQPLGQPLIRKIGNVGLTFLNKLSTGYWEIHDPVNGLLVFDKRYLGLISKFQLEKRYLFESSVLYVSSFLNARVIDFPCSIIYEDEKSSLSIKSELPRFLKFHVVGFYKRIIHDYLYPNFDLSILGVIGSFALPFGLFFSAWDWVSGLIYGVPTEPGTLVFDMLLILIGYISLIFFLQRDQRRKNNSFPVSELIIGEK